MKGRLIIFLFLLSSAGTANAQEAFKHLSAGLDLGTTGIGLELALPLVTDHLVLCAGYNWGNFHATIEPKKNMNVAPYIDGINQYITSANTYLEKAGEDVRLNELPYLTTAEGKGRIGLGTVKAVLEYYPVKTSSFHINAGVYIGGRDVVDADIMLQNLWNAFCTVKDAATALLEQFPEMAKQVGEFPEAKATFRGKTYRMTDSGIFNVGVQAAKVRPYLGIGFGRSVPKKRFGFQCDMGAIYTGKISIRSNNEVNEEPGFIINNTKLESTVNQAERIRFYPQLTFRLIYRIF